MTKRPATLAALIAAALVLAGAAFALSPASASVDTQRQTAMDNLANCQLLANNSTGTQRTRAQQCVTDQTRILQLLGAPTPTPTVVTPSPTPGSTPTVDPTTPAPTTVPPTTPPTTTQPPAGRACPAFPAMPDATCTGVPPGTVLRDCPSSITGGVWDGCRFRGTLTVRGTGTVIRNSLILGNVDAGDSGNCSQQSGLQIIDTEIDGSGINFGYNAAAVGFNCFSLLRVNGHGTGYGVNAAGKVTVTDSWLHDWKTWRTSDHKDAIISNGGSELRFVHNNLDCSYDTGDGLCSAAVGLFGDFAPIQDVVLERNLFNSQDGYCIYGGSTSGKPFPDASNVVIRDNLFGKKYSTKCGYYGPVTDVESGRGNVFENNRYTTGELINA